MKIATTIVEVLKYVDQDPAKAVRMYEGTGFKYLDYSFYHMLTVPNHPLMQDHWKDVIRTVKKTADELGFTFVQAHLPACKIIENGREDGFKACIRAIEACGILGIKNAVIHSSFCEGPYRYPEDKQAYFEANKPFFEALTPAMEEFDVNVLLENSCEVNTRGHFFPITAADLNEMIAYLNHSHFGAAWDIGHAHIQGLDQRKELMELGKNLKAVHIHDNNGKRDQHQAMFNGSLDFDSFMRGIVDSGFEGPFTFEIDGYLPYRENDSEAISKIRREIKIAGLADQYQLAKKLLEAYGIDAK